MEIKQFQTPILFLIFNRPDTTERVFQQIRAVQPCRLFVSADGPRLQKPGEDQKCAETRRIIEKIDWPCEVKTNFSAVNLGCRKAVSSGIDWFFGQVEEGIILEDDCLPDLSFFFFCEALLAHYRDDSRVMHIGGVNSQNGNVRGEGSYYFSQLCHVWGWATWKRAWSKYDVDLSSYALALEQGKLAHAYALPAMERYWKRNLDLVYSKMKDTWDIQWQYAVSMAHGLAVIPNTNLISNIGFSAEATHTKNNITGLSNRPTSSLAQIQHPAFMLPDDEADIFTFRKYQNPSKPVKLYRLLLSFIPLKRSRL
jgi:hypothetical protein